MFLIGKTNLRTELFLRSHVPLTPASTPEFQISPQGDVTMTGGRVRSTRALPGGISCAICTATRFPRESARSSGRPAGSPKASARPDPDLGSGGAQVAFFSRGLGNKACPDCRRRYESPFKGNRNIRDPEIQFPVLLEGDPVQRVLDDRGSAGQRQL